MFPMRESDESPLKRNAKICGIFLLATILAFAMRMLEWPSWQDPEYRFNNEMLLATHDAYHWLAGAEGFGRAVGHPMAETLRLASLLPGVSTASAAFWLPPVMASLVAGIVCLWGGLAGSLPCGLAAGLIACIAPGFLGRTLLGYYDTDLVTLLFPLLIAYPLAKWSRETIFHFSLAGSLKQYNGILKKKRRATLPFKPPDKVWTCLFALAGLLAWYGPAWHSVFPYLARYNVLLLCLSCLLLSPPEKRRQNLCLALCFSLPALGGAPGLLWPLITLGAGINSLPISGRKWLSAISGNKITLILLLLVTAALFAHGNILDTLLAQLNAYLKKGGDSHVTQGAALLFPSVAQSIIEVQDLSFTALFPYFHPWMEAALLGTIGFIYLLYKKPAFFYLLPFALLAFSSAKLGGRMIMFGAPIVALGLSLPFCQLTSRFLARPIGPKKSAWLSCAALYLALVLPFLDMIPAMSQGPSINRRHAAALYASRELTPADARLWLWWDWGYAAHYFARRPTIADGAEHGGPSLYLPAAVFATDKPRFGRQLIRYTSACGNIPGNVFRGMNGAAAQNLINRLSSDHYPLVRGSGRQFIIVSFEMLRLGFWISNFGNWNFISGTGEGGALSIVPQAVEYRLGTGEVRLEDNPDIILPSSIAIFEETGVAQRNYLQEWFKAHPNATRVQQQNEINSRRNINFLFNRITGEKLAVDGRIYSSLMVQLLLCDPANKHIAPYFRLVYDNVFTRIYEVLPADAASGQQAL